MTQGTLVTATYGALKLRGRIVGVADPHILVQIEAVDMDRLKATGYKFHTIGVKQKDIKVH